MLKHALKRSGKVARNPLIWVACGAATMLLAIPVLAANSPRDDLDLIITQLDDVIENLTSKSSLSRTELTALRRDLNRLSRDLDGLRDRLGNSQGGPKPQHPGSDWSQYSTAELTLWPNNARFTGWNKNRTFQTKTDDREGRLQLSIDNIDYNANWTISQIHNGKAQVMIDPMADGDIYLTVKDSRGSRELLIRNGGIGPLYIRKGGGGFGPPDKGTNPPRPEQGMAWSRPYEDLVTAGQISRSPGMDWFIGQVNADSYDASSLAGLGRYLRNNLPEQVRSEIGVLKYTQLWQTKRISIPDPRNSVSGFVYAMDKAYNFYQEGTNFSIELK
jgi:hypothetical protein